MYRYLYILACCFLLQISIRGYTQYVGIKEKLNAYIDTTGVFYNEFGAPVRLNEIIQRPVLITFIDPSCTVYCPKLLAGIAELIQFTNMELGQNFSIVTFNLEESDNLFEQQELKNKHIKNISDKAIKHWYFLSGSSSDIKKIANSAGYYYHISDYGYTHPLATILVTPSCKISRYFYGYYILQQHFTLAILDAWMEKSAPTRVKNLKFCYNNPPEKDPKARKIIIIGGIIIISIVLVVLIFVSLKPVKKDVEEYSFHDK